MEEGRIPLYKNTMDEFEKYGFPEELEILIVSRTIKDLALVEYKDIDVKLINYEWKGAYFTPSMGFNEGVKVAKYDNLVIAYPEVKPITNFFGILKGLPRKNYLSTVWDIGEKGNRTQVLVSKGFRYSTPAFYFLAVYKKEDILKINGWDEEFMKGYWYDDDEFGWRLHASGADWEIRSDIQGEHQYHSRAFYTKTKEDRMGMTLNQERYYSLIKGTLFKCKNGIKNEDRIRYSNI